MEQTRKWWSSSYSVKYLLHGCISVWGKLANTCICRFMIQANTVIVAHPNITIIDFTAVKSEVILHEYKFTLSLKILLVYISANNWKLITRKNRTRQSWSENSTLDDSSANSASKLDHYRMHNPATYALSGNPWHFSAYWLSWGRLNQRLQGFHDTGKRRSFPWLTADWWVISH